MKIRHALGSLYGLLYYQSHWYETWESRNVSGVATWGRSAITSVACDKSTIMDIIDQFNNIKCKETVHITSAGFQYNKCL